LTGKINIAAVRKDYLTLRDKQLSLQMATIDSEGFPEASYAPFVWYDGACYLFLSQLAAHTRNLNNNASIGLLIIEDESDTRNQFARRRIMWQGQAVVIDRESRLFQIVMQSFRDRFGDFIDIIEPLQDFQLFEIVPSSGRFVRGFGQAFQLSGDGLKEISHIDPGRVQMTTR
jgi:putative heme iron utilization protein